ncbi:MAG: methylenetetrahydrofolate reductase [Chloroflexota bacterium]|nr:methylenetetrahydrofolate reductase [Chloroflexota bacterium]
MTKVSDAGFEVTGRTTFICDYSPPRSGNPCQIDTPPSEADFLLVNRNPGRAARTDSAMLAAHLRQRTGQEVIFALLTRDMNRLAIQSYLLGAQLLGLENVVIAQGDPFTTVDADSVSAVREYRPTELIEAIAAMNRGTDFRSRSLDSPSSFCVGATLDPSADLLRQVALASRKVSAGAGFLVTQPIFDPKIAFDFQAQLARLQGDAAKAPVYWGLQLLESGSISMGAVPESIRYDLEAGRPGVDIALELYEGFRNASIHNIYLLPSIRRGGIRDYSGAQEFMAAARALK